MKRFWLIYAVVTVALVAFCCSFLDNLLLCWTIIAGAAGSASLLVHKRHVLMQLRYLALLALVASIASVALGFIVIFLIAAADAIFG